MSMTRKDYKAIAAAIKAARPTPENWRGMADLYQAKQFAIDAVQNRIAMYLTETNPRFDRMEFAEASGDNWIMLPAAPVVSPHGGNATADLR